MQQIIQVEIQDVADLLGRITVAVKIVIHFVGKFVQIGTEKLILEQSCRLK